MHHSWICKNKTLWKVLALVKKSKCAVAEIQDNSHRGRWHGFVALYILFRPLWLHCLSILSSYLLFSQLFGNHLCFKLIINIFLLCYRKSNLPLSNKKKTPKRKVGQVEPHPPLIADFVIVHFAKGKITIGERFGINKFSRIVAHEKIEIGDRVTIGQMVSILDHDHRYEMQENQLYLDGYTTAPVRIGSNIWIGDKCTILK